MSIFERRANQLPIVGNPCLDHCEAGCCRDIFFIGLSAPDLKKLTPDGTKVVKVARDELSAVYDEARERDRGVYVTEFPDQSFDAVLVGKCPNLKPDNKCGIYETRPAPCADFDAGGVTCILLRNARGFKPFPRAKNA